MAAASADRYDSQKILGEPAKEVLHDEKDAASRISDQLLATFLQMH
jgi:hypothetical protein